MITESASVDLINTIEESLFNSLVDKLCTMMLARLSLPTSTAADLVSMSLPAMEEQVLADSLHCSDQQARQLTQCMTALLLKCGLLGDGESLMGCGLLRGPAEALASVYARHRHSFAPHLAALAATHTQEVCGVAFTLSVDTGSSTRSRLCVPQAVLQFNTRVPLQPVSPDQASKTATNTAERPQKTAKAAPPVLVQLDKKRLYQLYQQLEQIQERLDSFE